MVASFSADIGCVRLTERCLHSDPPTTAEVAAAREVVRERLDVALRVVPVEGARTWVGLAGTMTTLSRARARHDGAMTLRPFIFHGSPWTGCSPSATS